MVALTALSAAPRVGTGRSFDSFRLLFDVFLMSCRSPSTRSRSKCDANRGPNLVRNMILKSLLMSSDEKTVRVLRRVLSDLEIDIEHCTAADSAIRRITRQRFEAIIVDGANAEEAGSVL